MRQTQAITLQIRLGSWCLRSSYLYLRKDDGFYTESDGQPNIILKGDSNG